MSRDLRIQLATLIVALSVFITPGQRDLVVGDETKYGQVIREMRDAHVFFMPQLGGRPFTHKPPVHFWLIDLLTFLFGRYSTWAYVLPSIAAFLILILLMRRIGAELFERDAGRVAAFVSATSLLIWTSAQSARMDVEFTLLSTAGIFLLFRFFARADFRALNWSALLVSLALVIKGPMSVVIWLFTLLLEGVRRKRMPRGNYAPALAILIFVPLAWLVPAVLIGGRDFANEILFKQTVGRAVSSWVHKAPVWYYLTHAPATFFPWFFVLLVAIVALLRLRGALSGDAASHPTREAVLFCLSWIAAVVIPYSLMSSKLDVYMMMAVPPVALLIGAFVTQREMSPRAVRWGVAGNLVPIVLILAAGLVALLRGAALVKGPEAAMLLEPAARMWLGSMVVLSLSGLILIAVSRDRLVDSVLAAGLTLVIPMIVLASLLMPRVNELISTSTLIASLEKQHVRGDDIILYSCPQLWSRDFPHELERVRYVDAAFGAGRERPAVVATSRAHASEIAVFLRDYRKVDEVRMIGKWFDIYRRTH